MALEVGNWSTTDASNTFTVPDGAPEGWLGKDVNNVLRAVMGALRRFYADIEWLDLDWSAANTHATITRLSTTQFKVVGMDATSWMTVNRRVKLVGGTTDYGFITASSFSTDTTVTVTMDGGDVPASLTKSYVHCGRTLAKVAFNSDAVTLASLLPVNLGDPWRNKLVNGDFQIWQRGTSFTAEGYTADRWRATLGTGGAATISRQSHTLGQTDVPDEPQYFLRWTHGTNSSSVPILEQRIESVRTMAGQKLTASVYLKCGSTMTVVPKFKQFFGSGGSADVDSTAGSFAVTSSWTRFTYTVTLGAMTGKTIGAGDYLTLRLEMPTGATFTLDVSDAQVERGGTVSQYARQAAGDALDACQRFFAKTFPQATAPAQSAGNTGTINTVASGTAIFEGWSFPRTMRAIPTITTYAPDAASSNWSSGVAASVFYTSESLTNFYSAGAADQNAYSIHATADAEL